jgi:hypothetical protein
MVQAAAVLQRRRADGGQGMGELLGLGITHAPMFQFPDENMADILRDYLQRESTPPPLRSSENWPPPMRDEWGTDEGLTAARAHRETVVQGFRQLRAVLDAFAPDLVLIWGDDQYENFKEDVVPPFCVYVYDTLDCLPYRRSPVIRAENNVWNRSPETVVPIRGHREAAAHLARQLILEHFDVAYAFKPHHHPTLAHAFMRTILYLDYDQQGFPYPIIPFHVNCYGSDLLKGPAALGDGAEMPPAPTPARCFDLGRAVARILGASPWRAALVGSSSWSHAFLTRKHHGLYPDVEADRARLRELEAGEHTRWRDLTPDQLRDAGQHEFLNWVCLAGAMAERPAEVVTFAETWLFNSTKAAAIFRP